MESSVKRMRVQSQEAVEESAREARTESGDEDFDARADEARSVALRTRREAWRRMGEMQRRRRLERVRKSAG